MCKAYLRFPKPHPSPLSDLSTSVQGCCFPWPFAEVVCSVFYKLQIPFHKVLPFSFDTCTPWLYPSPRILFYIESCAKIKNYNPSSDGDLPVPYRGTRDWHSCFYWRVKIYFWSGCGGGFSWPCVVSHPSCCCFYIYSWNLGHHYDLILLILELFIPIRGVRWKLWGICTRRAICSL